jgi:uncharacterized membrane protein YfcA
MNSFDIITKPSKLNISPLYSSIALTSIIVTVVVYISYDNILNFQKETNYGNSDNMIHRFLMGEDPNMIHKDLYPLDTSDYVGTMLVGLGLMIAASGGIGGGGILVPLLILVYGFHPKYAIPLSNFTILGSSIMNMILNAIKRHPSADRPLVDWDLILIMEPLTMAGAVVGALVGKILPDWILVLMLVILLAQTTYITIVKAISQYKKESKEMENSSKSEVQKALAAEKELTEIEECESLLSERDKNENNEADLEKTPDEIELLRILDEEKETPTEKVVILTLLVVGVVGLTLLKGGGVAMPSPIGVKCGSDSYWFLTILVFVYIGAIMILMRTKLIKSWKVKRRVNYKYQQGDIEWNERNTIIYPCICFFAGFFAGMFGIGGGVVKGPLMLQMGVHPLVASGTVAVMIMFTSVAATVMFVAFGTLTWDYACFLFIFGLVSTAIGQFGVSYLVDKYKRYSFISMSIGAVVAISTVLMALQSIFSIIDAKENGNENLSLCPQ